MSNPGAFQLPAGIVMPERFAAHLSYQLWFYDGVQTGLEGFPPQEEAELSQHYGGGIVAAYKAGFEAGHRKRMEIEASSPAVSVPEGFDHSLAQRNWYLKGVEDGVAGLPLERPASLPFKHSADLLKAYKEGYLVGRRRT